jgi:hypothetical protein
MLRLRLSALAAFAVVFALAAAPAGAQSVELPDAPVGGSSGIDCFFVCIVEQGSPGACNSGANIGGRIDVIATAPPFFVSNFRRGPAPSGGSNACDAGTANPVALPANLSPGQVLFFDLDFMPTAPGTYDGNIHLEGQGGSETLIGDIPVSAEATGGDPTAPCVPGPQTLCLNGGRFKVEVDWATNQGTSGAGNVVPFQVDDSGLFWFFSETNWEVVIKVLDACVVNDRFWVFAGGLTNVQTVITVTDTQTGVVKPYLNPQSTPFQPVQDTNAFATCP